MVVAVVLVIVYRVEISFHFLDVKRLCMLVVCFNVFRVFDVWRIIRKVPANAGTTKIGFDVILFVTARGA